MVGTVGRPNLNPNNNGFSALESAWKLVKKALGFEDTKGDSRSGLIKPREEVLSGLTNDPSRNHTRPSQGLNLQTPSVASGLANDPHVARPRSDIVLPDGPGAQTTVRPSQTPPQGSVSGITNGPPMQGPAAPAAVVPAVVAAPAAVAPVVVAPVAVAPVAVATPVQGGRVETSRPTVTETVVAAKKVSAVEDVEDICVSDKRANAATLKLQRGLIEAGLLPKDSDDGMFGKNTAKALDKYLEKEGIKPGDARRGNFDGVDNAKIKEGLKELDGIKDGKGYSALERVYVPQERFEKAPALTDADKSLCFDNDACKPIKPAGPGM
jgi:hypothetical protein